MDLTRRQAILNGLFGAGMIGLRSLATGLPLAFLANPLKALADEDPTTCGMDPSKAQYLILCTSQSGDPVNANVPGTYTFPSIAHSGDVTMAPTSISLGGQTYTAAKPWNDLPDTIKSRLSFFHHTTLTNNHGNQNKVMELMGAVKRQEMLASLFAKNLAPCLGTVQHEPIVVGAAGTGELLSYEGRILPKLSPSGLRDMLTTPTGQLAQLQQIRDADLNRLNALLKTSGNNVQRSFLDRMASSQTEARSISQSLLDGLSTITGDDANNQATAAAVLIKMNVSPVISMHISFGGDNHVDANLAGEAKQTVAGAATMAILMQKLADQQLADRVTFAIMNVFGRTLSTKGTTGRDHLANHHCTVMFGKNIKPSVIGGLMPNGNDYKAQSIDSASGHGLDSGGDIPFGETLGAVGKTLGVALGVPSAVLDDNITLGKAVPAALV